MEGKMIMPDTVTKFEILNGEYSTAEALALINRMLDHEFRHYKVKIISDNHSNVADTLSQLKPKMLEYSKQKMELKNKLKYAREQGYDVKIEGLVTVKLEKKDNS